KKSRVIFFFFFFLYKNFFIFLKFLFRVIRKPLISWTAEHGRAAFLVCGAPRRAGPDNECEGLSAR
ncbi:hypothetical protein P9146_09010, partial [Bacillus licheniformis]|uniref:hypothetical protein n=1 Tax=Bacillus licheniformis TaxID=1402 RepID=UPI002DB740EC